MGVVWAGRGPRGVDRRGGCGGGRYVRRSSFASLRLHRRRPCPRRGRSGRPSRGVAGPRVRRAASTRSIPIVSFGGRAGWRRARGRPRRARRSPAAARSWLRPRAAGAVCTSGVASSTTWRRGTVTASAVPRIAQPCGVAGSVKPQKPLYGRSPDLGDASSLQEGALRLLERVNYYHPRRY